MLKLIPYIRKIVLCFSTLLAVGIFIYVSQYIGDASNSDLVNIKYAEYFALTAFTFLLFSLLPTPLYLAFPKFPLRAFFTKARRAIGVSAFFFALLHVYFAFFKIIGGFGLYFDLPKNYQQATILGLISLIILSMLAATSFDFMVKRLGRRWKQLHRFIYFVAILVPIHAFLIGTHFNSNESLFAKFLVFGWMLLLLLEEIRIYNFLVSRFPKISKHIFSILLLTIFILVFYQIMQTNLFLTHGH